MSKSKAELHADLKQLKTLSDALGKLYIDHVQAWKGNAAGTTVEEVAYRRGLNEAYGLSRETVSYLENLINQVP